MGERCRTGGLRAGVADAALRTAAFAAGSALVVALRVLDRGQPLSPRTLGLLLLMFLGALLAGLVLFGLNRLVARRWPRAARFWVAAPLAAGGFAGASALLFGVLTKFIQEQVEDEHGDDPLHNVVIGKMIDAVGLFVVTGQPYLWPWPIFAVALLGGLLAALPAGPAVAALALRSRPARDTGPAALLAERPTL